MTSPAVGVHAHPTRKLGKRPASARPSVAVGEFLLARAAGLPQHPADDPVPAGPWPMDDNDKAGDCVVAAVDHALQAVCTQLGVPRTAWTDDQILALYATQNPGFQSWADAEGPNDNGMDIQTFLEHLVSTGDIVAFGRIDHTDIEMLKAATYVGLAIVTGETLTRAQQNQTVWDYVPGDAIWGGHATVTVGYTGQPDQQDVVSWGAVYPVTEAFVANQVSEAWLLLTQAHLDHPGFRDSFDIAGFAAAISDLTGGKVIVPVPPSPQPTPPPAPAPAPPPPPVDPLADFPFTALDAWAAWPVNFHRSRLAAKAYRTWEAEHGFSRHKRDDAHSPFMGPQAA